MTQKKLTVPFLTFRPGEDAAVSDANNAAIRYNSALARVEVSINGGPYQAIGSGGGTGGGDATIPMAIDESTDLSVPVLIGGKSFTAGSYFQVQFVTVAAVTSIGLTGEISLWNLTDSLLVTTHEYTSTTPTETVTSIKSLLPDGNKLYEVRHRVLGGANPVDRIVTNWAGIRAI